MLECPNACQRVLPLDCSWLDCSSARTASETERAERKKERRKEGGEKSERRRTNETEKAERKKEKRKRTKANRRHTDRYVTVAYDSDRRESPACRVACRVACCVAGAGADSDVMAMRMMRMIYCHERGDWGRGDRVGTVIR